MKAKKLTLLGAISATLLLTACQGNSTNQDTQGNNAQQDLELSSSAAISTMEPSQAGDTTSTLAMSQVFEGLYVLGPDDELQLGVAAEEPEISEDETVYTFTLRDDAEWSDGTPVTADDFVFAFQKITDPKYAAPNADVLFDVVKNAREINLEDGDIDTLGVKAIDDKTLEFTLERPVPYFKSLLAYPVLYPQNKEYVENQGKKYATDSDHLIYNGPFKLSDWSASGDDWGYEKNESYWDKDEVKLDKANVTVVKTPSTAINLYTTDALDMIDKLSSEYIPTYKDDPSFESVEQFTTFFLKMNSERDGKKNALDNENIRKGIAQAFDKESFVKNILQDDSNPTDHLIPKGQTKAPDGKKDFTEVADERNDYLSYDPEKAKEAWEKGKEELGVDKVELGFLTDDTEEAKKNAEFFQYELQDNLPGLEITVEQVPFTVRVDRDSNKEYDLELAGWGTDYRDPLTVMRIFMSSSDLGGVTYSNEDYDKLIQDTREDHAADKEARFDDFVEAQDILINQDAVIAPIYNRSLSTLVNPSVKDLHWHAYGPSYSLKWAYKE
ncbi:peptide ABC transporter substrate-binding protein [Tetragenococcus halophilus]|uniref:peptide ABC transporter substrate-binding protein n=1 Tax=Tetragenococcus halophilus TaxID=51669 RepID=UPI0025AEFDA6|nr:peptide ABC transporter substrate-binding protein [Tetragenococcus halophilus]WJS82186.1 peptide ABC transporter substrate-binding protein [Tetragenococcus halophilus]